MVNGNLCRELRRAVFHGIARRGVAPVAERQFDNVTNKRFYKHRERLHGNNIQIFMIWCLQGWMFAFWRHGNNVSSLGEKSDEL